MGNLMRKEKRELVGMIKEKEVAIKKLNSRIEMLEYKVSNVEQRRDLYLKELKEARELVEELKW